MKVGKALSADWMRPSRDVSIPQQDADEQHISRWRLRSFSDDALRGAEYPNALARESPNLKIVR